ncbi:MAG: hypothetical protein K0R53_3464, partial [Burkholderiales bacterium]|nr:hypothetical protein [Burkholderiales bacterium]
DNHFGAEVQVHTREGATLTGKVDQPFGRTSANPDSVFEHKQGFFNVFNGEGTYDAARVLTHWAAPLDIVEPGIAIKQYPCCGSTHSALDAMLTLVREHDFKANDVDRIDVWTHPRRLEHTNRPEPKSALDAKFSLQYCLTRAATDRRIMIEHFEIITLAPRCRCIPVRAPR